MSAAIRANPIGAAAAAIGAVASGFALFSDGAKTASASWRQLADDVRKANLEAEANSFLGRSDVQAQAAAKSRSYASAVGRISSGGEQADLSFTELQQVLGGTRLDTVRALARSGNAAGRDLLRGGFGEEDDLDEAVAYISRDQALDIFRRADQGNQGAAVADFSRRRASQQLGPIGGGLGDSFREYRAEFGAQSGQGTVRINPEDQVVVSQEKYRKQLERQVEFLDRAVEASQRLGQTLGGALFDAVSGANTLRGALAAAFQSVARQGLQDSVGGLFGTITKAIGATAKQRAADNGVDPGPLAGNE